MLTYLGITPSFSTDPDWYFHDVVDLGLGQWVLLQKRRPESAGTPNEIRAIGVYRYGKWQQYIAPAVWQESLPGAGINRDAQYLWRAPNIADNPNNPPVPPQGPGFAATDFVVDPDTEEVRSTGPVDSMPPVGSEGTGPGNAAALPGWYVLDGSPTRWASVGVGYKYTLASGVPYAYARPMGAWVSINGVAIEVPDWTPWSSYSNFDPFRLSMCWVREGDGWTTSTFMVPEFQAMFQPAGFEIGLGSRYGVVLANHSIDLGGGVSDQVVSIAVIDRAKGTARSLRWMGGTAGTGPVVKGNTALFYGTHADLNSGKPVRVILDLTTMTIKTEDCPTDIDGISGTYAPSYMSDVPRIVSLVDSGSGEGPRRLVMDNDMIEVAGQHISYSGNNLLLRGLQVPGFGQDDSDVDRSWVELVVWTPDSNLAGGDSTLKGYFL